MTRLIQIADEQATSTDIVRLVGLENDALVPLFTYLISEKDGLRFFLQTSTPNRNLSRFSPNPFDVISLAQMLALLEDKGYAPESLVSEIRFYEANVVSQLDDHGESQTPTIRPSTGALANPASAAAVTKALKLPDDRDGKLRIGQLANSGEAVVPVAIDLNVLRHHILVAGSTGSGKSNLLANIAHVADELDHCVILFDHKPDHQNHHQQNLDSLYPRDFSNVRYWTLNPSDGNKNAELIGIQAQRLPAELLAATIFHRPGEELQAEIFAAIAVAYSQDRTNWTIRDLQNFVLDNENGVITALLGANIPIPAATLGAIKRRLRFGSGRIPSFIDREPPLDAFGNVVREVRPLLSVFQKGLNVIRIEEGDARGYALFLSQLLRTANDIRVKPDGIGESQGILVIIDEAADIFKAESRHLSRVATGELNSRIRRGRSLKISYVIAVQDAGDVPATTRQNLNSTIIGRHRHLEVLREALPTAAGPMLANADKLAPGEMLGDIFGIPSMLHLRADISRTVLTKLE